MNKIKIWVGWNKKLFCQTLKPFYKFTPGSEFNLLPIMKNAFFVALFLGLYKSYRYDFFQVETETYNDAVDSIAKNIG